MVHIVSYTLNTAQCTLKVLQCTGHRAQFTQTTVNFTLHPALCMHSALCTLLPSHFTLHTAHCTWHTQTANCTLHRNLIILFSILIMPNAGPDMKYFLAFLRTQVKRLQIGNIIVTTTRSLCSRLKIVLCLSV